MGDLTKNFSKAEFACKCGCGKCDVSPVLVAALQKLRDSIGKPIKINSACRCEKHNKDVGGVKNSFHVQGKAADIAVDGMTPSQVALFALKIPEFANGGLGIYYRKRFVHVDVRGYWARWKEK